MRKKNFALCISGLFVLTLLAFSGIAVSQSPDNFCSSTTESTCTVSGSSELTGTVNFSGTVTFESDTVLTGSGNIYADKFEGLNNIDLSGDGNFLLCERTGAQTSCEAGTGPAVEANYSIESNRFIYRQLNNKWSPGYVNWTDDISKTTQLNSSFESTDADYTISGLTENLDFKLQSNQGLDNRQDSGVNFSHIINQSFSNGVKENLTGIDALRLEASGTSLYNVPRGTAINPGRPWWNEFTLDNNVYVDEIWTTTDSGNPATETYYELYNTDTGNTLVSGNYQHSSTDVVNIPIDRTLLESGYRYQLKINYLQGGKYPQYYDTGTDSPYENGAVNWLSRNDSSSSSEQSFYSMGVNVIDGYKKTGSYTSEVLNMNEVVDWNKSTVEDNTDNSVSLNQEAFFAASNVSNPVEWSFKSSIDALKDSQYLKYRINLSTDDTSVTPIVEALDIAYNPPGADGLIDFSSSLSDTKMFGILETVAPVWSNQAQASDITGAKNSNALSADVQDSGSGLNKVILATNESGVLENRSSYSRDFDSVFSEEAVSFNWKNSSFQGSFETVKWEIWMQDTAGNWASTASKEFDVDGVPPEISGLNYENIIDVDGGETNVNFNSNEDETELDSVKIEENSSGSIQNTWLGTVGSYSPVISRENPGEVHFTIYATDSADNVEEASGVISFQNISIDENLNASTVNSSEKFKVSGEASLLPYNSPETSNIELWAHLDEWTKLGSNISPDNDGSFSRVTSIEEAGTHELKLNTTNSDGISGLAENSITVLLDVNKVSSKFDSTDNSHVDIDTADKNLNLSANISRPVDGSVDTVTANVSKPDGTFEEFILDSQEGRTWYNVIDTDAEFGNLMGQYNVTFSAETNQSIGSNLPKEKFFIENISVTSEVEDRNISIGEETGISGNTWLEPYRDFQDYGNVTVELEDGKTENFSLNSGDYTGQIKTSEPGNKTVNITYETQDGVRGQNSTYFYAYNLSARIENVNIDSNQGSGLQIYKDNSSDGDIQFSDIVEADADNPFDNYNVTLDYDYPPGWGATFSEDLGTIEKGASKSINPDFNIRQTAGLGPQQINISTDTRNDIVSKDNVTVEVWSKSESDYLNLEPSQSLNREKSFYNVTAEVTDLYSGDTLQGINTSIYVGGYGRISSDVSNESGLVELPINLSLIGTGSDFTASVKTHDNTSKYINSSEKIFDEGTTRSFSVEGQMQRGQEDEITPVYRKNDVTGILGEIQDSTGDALPNVTTFLSINGTVYGPKETGNQYDSDLFGYYQYSYDAPNSILPGLYNATINASKDQFAPFEFNRTVEIRGKLSINNLVERDIVQRGKAFYASSSVEDEFSEKTYGNVSWNLNSTDLGQGENASLSVPKSLERGKYDLEASTARKFYDDDSSVKDVEVYGLASVDLKPDDFTIKPGNTVTLEATVEDANTSDRIENYPVKFSIDGTEYTRMTNSTGMANYDWSVSTGNYEVSATIDDNSSLNYNTSEASDTTEVEVRDKLYLDKYEFSNKDIYRYVRTPYWTVFNINLTRNSDTINRVPVDNEKVEFTINSTHTIPCTTDSTGACKDSLIYYPGSEVSAGNLTVRATTDRPDSVDVNETNNLIVRGQLQTTLENPSANSNLPRGESVQLEATTDTLVGGEVQRNLTWSINGKTIEPRGYDTSWEVPFTEETGQKTLTATGDGDFFASDSDSVNVWILGNAEARLNSPENNSAVGYAEPVQVRCEARSQGATINNYPVEFVENSSGSYEVFATKQTEDTGDKYQATASWQPPEQVTTVDMGCRIEDNRTVGYRAETPLDTKVFQTLDDVPPDITNVDIPEGVNPDSQANITFNASDEEGLQDVKVTVTTPALTKDYPEVNKKTGTGYKSIYDTTGRANGDYEVDITVTDNSGNTVTVKNSFSIRPGGEIKVDKEDIVARNITQSKSHSESIEASLKVDETANNADINLVLDDSDVLSANTTGYNCGDLESGDYCNRSFNVTVPSKAPPTLGSSLYATVRGNWKNPDKAEGTTVSDFTAVKIKKNPRMKELRGNYSFPIPHGDSASIDFKPESFGNSPLKDYRAVFTENTLNRSWVTITNGEEASISPGDTITTDYDISIPTGTAATTYSSQVDLLTSNSDNLSREISVTVPPDRTYSVPDSLTASAVKGINGTLVEFQVNSTGNVDLDLDYRGRNTDADNFCAQNILEGTEYLEKQGAAMIEVKYDFEGVDRTGQCAPNIEIDPGNGDEIYEGRIPDRFNKNVTVNIDVVEFNVTPSERSYEGMPGENRRLSFDAELGGSAVNEDNIDYHVEVGGERADIPEKKAFGNGTFSLNYSIPQVPDGRTHNVEVIVEQTSKGIERTKNAGTVSVPDITPPQFQFFDIQGVDPGETQEIEVPVSDNSGTVENVSMRLEGPANVSNHSLSKVTGEEKWSVSIPDVEKGVYRANFTAYDPSGFSSSVADTFRVSSNTVFDGSFTTPDGGVNSGADLVFTDSETNRSIPASIDNSGGYSVDLKQGNYDITAEFDNQQVRLQNTPVNENTSGFRAERLSEVDTSGLTPSDRTDARVMGIGVDTGLEPESATITFNYSEANIPSGYSLSELEVARCPNYNYGGMTCDSSSYDIYDIGRLDVNKAHETITIDTQGFSSYTLFAPSEDSNQEQDQQEEESSSGGGGGGGSFPEDTLDEINESVSETQEQVENLSGRLNDTTTEGAELGSSSINAELRPGESKTVSLSIANTANDSQTFIFNTNDVVSDYIEVTDSVTLVPGESRDIILNISAPAGELAGSYSGTLSIESDEINTEIPVNVQILPPQNKLLDMSLDPVFSSVRPGDALQVETTFSNQGYARNVDVTAKIDVIDPDTNASIASISETVAVGTTLNRVFEIDIPKDTELKSYAIRGSARYTNLDVARVATAASSIEIDMPFWSRTFFGVTYQNIGLGFLLLLLVSSTGLGLYHYKRKKELQKKRYMENIDLDTIPTGGNNQAYLGQLAEVGTRTFLDLDDLTTHALIAGATGSGKTVTGQVMVEEALENGANVIVLDPTAQWTGYLRENQDENMFELYDKFGLSRSDARGFDGNIRAVEPGEEIDITPYLEQDEDGQIIVFSLHKLDSKNIDEFANKTIQQIFDANLPERNGLETVIVYDEVHRLLEKFGGNGEGIKQLERGAREFRKWGVGMVLLSQVISDFSGEIRANIGTTVQMRTQYDDDLERIKNKFGIDTVKSIAKAEVGSGMLQSSDYNHGRPYFIDFRPLLHSPHRLSDEELDKYEEYNKRIDKIEEKVDQMEEDGEEVYEYRSELKLTKRNLKKGSFSLVDTYIDELEEKLDM